jgi:hypothetical protein
VSQKIKILTSTWVRDFTMSHEVLHGVEYFGGDNGRNLDPGSLVLRVSLR